MLEIKMKLLKADMIFNIPLLFRRVRFHDEDDLDDG